MNPEHPEWTEDEFTVTVLPATAATTVYIGPVVELPYQPITDNDQEGRP